MIKHARPRPVATIVLVTAASLSFLFSAAPGDVARAQEAPPQVVDPAISAAPATPAELTPQMVERQLAEVDTLTQLDEAARQELKTIYQEALRLLGSVGELRKRSDLFSAMTQSAPEKLTQARFQKSVQSATVTIDAPPNATLGELDERLKTAQGELEQAKRRLEQLKADAAGRPARRSEIDTKERALVERRKTLQAELTGKRDSTVPKDRALATRLAAELLAVEAELKLYEHERAAYAATVDLLPLELELAERSVSVAGKRVELWNKRVEQKRAEMVAAAASDARTKEQSTPEALKPLAARNRELADESRDLAAAIAKVNGDLEKAKDVLEQVEQKFKVTQEKVDEVGLNYTIGLLLRKEDAALPSVSHYRYASRDRAETIRDVQLRRIDLVEERSEINDVEYADNLLASIDPLPPKMSKDDLSREITTLLDDRKELITTLDKNLNDYFDRLFELESTQEQVREAVADFGQYIDERVLWIRSSGPLSLADIRDSAKALQWLLDRDSWLGVWNGVVADFKTSFVLPTVVWLAWLVLLLLQRRARKSITRDGLQASSGSCRSFSPTLLALAWTLLVTLLWPALISILVWGLERTGADNRFARAAAAGLTAAGVYYLTLEFMRQLCRTKGLADAHFGWPQGGRVALRKNVRWLMLVSLPMVFVAQMFYFDAGNRTQDNVAVLPAQESAARLLIIATLITAGVFTHRVFRPGGPLFSSLQEELPPSRLYSTRMASYGLAMLLLGFLLVLALIGYDFTAARLASRLYESVLLLEVLVVIMALITRWLVIVRRKMAIQQAQQRRAQQLAAQGEEAGELASLATMTENAPDPTLIGQQSRQLLQSLLVLVGLGGLWYIWIDVIPALNFLDRFTLWEVATDTGKSVITVNNLVVAVVVVVATVLAAKNIPGLLEIVLLSRLPLDAGNRYAIITISRYVLTIIGIVLAFGAMGISWSSYQWLVAAVSVGLGFGLQEIFANFVSGLIVLFEQPIRVGDIVTIGDVTGVVSRIRMRATTVTNWDRQEFIVPNREFITGRLLNWTLSNTVNRVVITAGIAYGSDPDQVRGIMLEIARDHRFVLDDPEPNVTFEQFGDSTLNIVLRCYLADLENRLLTIHELNTEVHRRLNEAGVEFAFPTRELYFRNALPATDSSPPVQLPTL